MKRKLFSLALLAAATSLVGCVISIGGRTQTAPPEPVPPPPVVVTDPEQAATVAEIEAASRFSMDSARAQTLAQIAERPALSPTVQVHLVNTAYRCLSFDSSKVQVLEKLIARTDFPDATRHAIVSQLHRLSFESSKQQLLNQINQRMTPAK
jgi:hypothetical protein